MDFTYEKLSYQDEAVAAVIDTLSGDNDSVVFDELDLSFIDENVQKIQSKYNLPYPGNEYLSPFPQFNIEMETGTGKTMVYLRTIMEIHKKFNENKFIIVVPNRAIKAGVENSLKTLRDYLSTFYNTGKYNYFIYDSKKLGELQAFEDTSFQIMVTTVQAFNTDENIIRQDRDDFFGDKPIDIIRDSNPIVIIDEPQSVDGGDAGKKAIRLLNPKIALRYSATHKNKKYPSLYRFGPIEAYEGRYVKRIETLGVDINSDGNIPNIELKSIENKSNQLQAKVSVYKMKSGEFEKGTITLKRNDSIVDKTKNVLYSGLGNVTEINAMDNYIKFENHKKIYVGDFDEENEIWLNIQIRSLIKDHLDRELELQKKGIKVLSLIFLDSVNNYRVYKDKLMTNGKYAELFESIYLEVIDSNEEYKELFDYNVPVSEIHDGYFSKDKTGFKNTKGNSKDDESAYKTIMMDKEGLLTQFNPHKPQTDTKASKLRFIFSHSALKEGWDNPNVFQILTISKTKSEMTRRQKIGRGLRIAVNQEGKRIYGDHNIVTIYANESFEDFAAGLQNEYIEAGIISNKITSDFFEGLLVNKAGRDDQVTNYMNDSLYDEEDDSSFKETITQKNSQELVATLQKINIIKNDGNMTTKQTIELQKPETQTKIIEELKNNNIDENYAKAAVEFMKIKFTTPKPTNRKNRKRVDLTEEGIENKLFKDLWDSISHKLNYKVSFDEETLINEIVNGDNPFYEMNIIKMTTVQKRALVKMASSKFSSELIEEKTNHFVWDQLPIMDITKQIADNTNLTRHAIIKIIKESSKLDSNFIMKIKQNPSQFTRLAIKKVKIHQSKLLSKSLIFVKTNEKWIKENLKPFDSLESVLWEVPEKAHQKTLYKKIAMDSQVERKFAESLAYEQKVKYFLKLPNWFKIPTPFGNYNPDWAILAEDNLNLKLYFVIDTKSTEEIGELRPEELDKLRAGRQAYEIISNVKFVAPVTKFSDLEI